MTRIADAFARARAENRAALVAYLCAGDPDLASTPALAAAIAEAGADVLEICVPFSDPTADGVTIQRASERALRAGTTLAGVLDAVRELRRVSEVPVVLFGYYNPFLTYGEARLAADARAAGVDALLVVDLPPEEAATLREPVVALGLDFIPLVAPTSTPERIALAARAATSFLYCVSMTGVTGSQAPDLDAAGRRAAEIARTTSRPVAVGFGLATPDDVRAAAAHADGVVVGSAIVRAIERPLPHAEREAAVRSLVTSLAAATRRS